MNLSGVFCGLLVPGVVFLDRSHVCLDIAGGLEFFIDRYAFIGVVDYSDLDGDMGVVSDPDESCMPAGCSPACPFRVMARFRYGSVRNFSSKRGRELPAGTLPRHRNSSQLERKKVQRENEPCFFITKLAFLPTDSHAR